ncbi:hypothetical protein AB0Y14_06595 [Rothia sp. HC945]|uniref:hypothetical protein n=1 Tax=Rothia sp. HC945 TaxID=3171170 RepID=UPI003F209AF8
MTTNVTTRETKKYISQWSIRSRALATTTMNVTDTVENPAATMAASLAVYPPDL